jgi:hypothetical protein
VLFQPVGEYFFDCDRRALVKRLPPLDEQRVVSHFLRERVLEGVLELRIKHPLVDELRTDELGERGVEVASGKLSDPPY